MENEIRSYNGKKQVKKGNSWRPCCDVEGCINRADKDICDYHKRVYPVLEKLDEKSKEDKVKDILKLKLIFVLLKPFLLIIVLETKGKHKKTALLKIVPLLDKLITN